MMACDITVGLAPRIALRRERNVGMFR